MSDRPTFAIIGGGLTGAKAVQALRKEGFDGRVRLFGAEHELPYERPPLSKGYLTGSEARDVIYVHPEQWYAEQEVDLHLGSPVTAISPAERQLTTASGDQVAYDKLLLATGATARRAPIPGADLAGVHYLREVPDADRLRAELAEGGRRVVVLGGGWIGLETAAAAREYGNQVTVVEQAPTPLHAALGPELGQVFADLHREHGVRVLVDTGIVELRGSGDRMTSVLTSAGEELPADLAIVGMGARPATDLAEAAGLDVDNGVVVDELLRSSHPDIYAAGDIASWPSTLLGRRLRVEHWDNARRSGGAAARAMLGGDKPYDPVPYFFTDQYDLGMEYSGFAAPGAYDRVVYRGDLTAREFIAFWLVDGRVTAAMNVNIWDVTKPLQRLIRGGGRVDEAGLTDPDQPLDSLASERSLT